MKVRAVVEGVFRSRVGDALFARLNEVVPTDSGDDIYYHCELDDGDPRLARLLDLLTEAGLRQWEVKAPQDLSSEYSLAYRRVYEPADFGRCRYVRLWPAVSIERLAKAPDGTTVLAEHELKRHKRAAFVLNEDDLVVPDRVKGVVEAGRFRDVSFRYAALADPDGADERWERIGGRWWQLVTPVTAPPRLPDSPSGRRFEDYEQRYRGSDLAAIEPFDVAFANKTDLAASVAVPLIVSKRFYELCVANKWKANYAPVGMEEP